MCVCLCVCDEAHMSYFRKPPVADRGNLSRSATLGLDVEVSVFVSTHICVYVFVCVCVCVSVCVCLCLCVSNCLLSFIL